MRIEDRFRVSRPLEETWDVLLDIERIAPCLPGAELREVEGEEFRGVVKVKVGPISAQYQGRAILAEVDEAGRRVVIDAQGRDTRGAGNAKASITVTMAEAAGATEVAIDTDLNVTGKVAQFGRGVLADVSAKLLAQFAENLERDVLAEAEPTDRLPPVAAPTGGPAADAAPEASPGVDDVSPPSSGPAAGAAGATGAGGATSGPRRVESRPAEPVDLLGVAGAPVGRRLVPLALGALAVLLVWRLLRRRRA